MTVHDSSGYAISDVTPIDRKPQAEPRGFRSSSGMQVICGRGALLEAPGHRWQLESAPTISYSRGSKQRRRLSAIVFSITGSVHRVADRQLTPSSPSVLLRARRTHLSGIQELVPLVRSGEIYRRCGETSPSLLLFAHQDK